MKPLDDAKFSGTKEVDEKLLIHSAKLQPWIDENVPNAGRIKSIEQFSFLLKTDTARTRMLIFLIFH